MNNREIDALVAEHVMGLWLVDGGYVKGYFEIEGIKTPHKIVEIPSFSTDIAAAWGVVERMAQEGWLMSIFHCGSFGYRVVALTTTPESNDTFATTDEAPLAICLAALKAKGVN